MIFFVFIFHLLSHKLFKSHCFISPVSPPPLLKLHQRPLLFALTLSFIFRQLLTCRLYSWEQIWSQPVCFLSILSLMNDWNSKQTQSSCVLWLLPPPPAFVSFPPSPPLQKTVRKVRGVVSHFSDILPHFQHFLLLSPPHPAKSPVLFICLIEHLLLTYFLTSPPFFFIIIFPLSPSKIFGTTFFLPPPSAPMSICFSVLFLV